MIELLGGVGMQALFLMKPFPPLRYGYWGWGHLYWYREERMRERSSKEKWGFGLDFFHPFPLPVTLLVLLSFAYLLGSLIEISRAGNLMRWFFDAFFGNTYAPKSSAPVTS